MKRAFWALSLAGLCLLCIGSGCSQPAPKPTQLDAGVADLFTAKTFNCRLPVVAVERHAGALGDVRACLYLWPDKAQVNDCTVKQASHYAPASVACLVRDQGAQSNAAYLAGSNDPGDKAVADAARAWIYDHSLGFISVEVSP